MAAAIGKHVFLMAPLYRIPTASAIAFSELVEQRNFW